MADDEPTRQIRAVFPAAVETVPRARHFIVNQLRAWGLDGVAASLEVAAGELVSNAVQHGQEPIEVIAAMLPDRVRLEVHDHGGGRPAIRPIRQTGPHIGGWGLRMVDQLVDVWGTHARPGCTIVWIEHIHPRTGAWFQTDC